MNFLEKKLPKFSLEDKPLNKKSQQHYGRDLENCEETVKKEIHRKLTLGKKNIK